MADFTGSLGMAPQSAPSVDVEIHLGEGRLRVTSNGQLIGDWSLEDCDIRAKIDGFHLFVEDEEAVLHTTDDAGFALAFGMRSAPPALRRHIAAALRPGHEVEISPRLKPRPPAPPGAKRVGA